MLSRRRDHLAVERQRRRRRDCVHLHLEEREINSKLLNRADHIRVVRVRESHSFRGRIGPRAIDIFEIKLLLRGRVSDRVKLRSRPSLRTRRETHQQDREENRESGKTHHLSSPARRKRGRDSRSFTENKSKFCRVMIAHVLLDRVVPVARRIPVSRSYLSVARDGVNRAAGHEHSSSRLTTKRRPSSPSSARQNDGSNRAPTAHIPASCRHRGSPDGADPAGVKDQAKVEAASRCPRV